MANPETFVCSKCSKPGTRKDFHEEKSRSGKGFTRQREVTSWCKECRSRNYYTKRYSTLCLLCEEPRALDRNTVCVKCNAESGLRQCGVCENVLPMLMAFDGRRKKCKTCFKKPKVVE